MENSIAAIVVTYNREKLLIECLDSLFSQSRTPDAIFIIDNKSNITTPEILLQNNWIDKLPDLNGDRNQILTKILKRSKKEVSIFYIRKKINDGGAGGFYEGIKQAYENHFDRFWIMDDDVIADFSALEELEKAEKINSQGFFCSRVVGTNGISMNNPEVDLKKGKNYYSVWDDQLDKGLVRVKSATFVSVYLTKELVKEVGYPIQKMFIWGDDMEYTLRISKKYSSYLVGKSIVCHKREISKPPSIKTEKNRNRIKMHYYRFRNQIYYTWNHYRKIDLVLVLMETMYKFFFSLFRLRFYACYIIVKGTMAGLFFHPQIKYPE